MLLEDEDPPGLIEERLLEHCRAGSLATEDQDDPALVPRGRTRERATTLVADLILRLISGSSSRALSRTSAAVADGPRCPFEVVAHRRCADLCTRLTARMVPIGNLDSRGCLRAPAMEFHA